MPGSKPPLERSRSEILEEPWSNPQGTENEIKRTHRLRLPPGYPADLSTESHPEGGSIGALTMPIRNRVPPFRLRGR